MILGFGVLSLAFWLVHFVFGTRKSMTVIATGVLMVTIGWLFALINLYPLNGIYLRYGKIKPPPRP